MLLWTLASRGSFWKRIHFDLSPGGVIYREARARDLLDLHFVLVDVCAIPRSCNRCAHELAHSGLDRDPDAPKT
jgi:hypothetical protein